MPGKWNALVVATFDSAGRALDQVLADKGGEVGVVRAMIGRFDHDGALISVDALYCCEGIAGSVRCWADYVLYAKDNHHELGALAHAQPWSEIENFWEDRKSGHGRDHTRTIKILAAGSELRLDISSVRRVARMRRGEATTKPAGPGMRRCSTRPAATTAA